MIGSAYSTVFILDAIYVNIQKKNSDYKNYSGQYYSYYYTDAIQFILYKLNEIKIGA